MVAELVNRQVSSGGLLAPQASTIGLLSEYLSTTTAISAGLFSGSSTTADDRMGFQRERMAFRLMMRQLKQYSGQFVAIHDGRVAAVDASRNAVVRKFFAEHPAGTSVYVGFVGPRPIARVPTPLVARHKI